MSDVVGPGPSLDSALLLTAWEVCKMLREVGVAILLVSLCNGNWDKL